MRPSELVQALRVIASRIEEVAPSHEDALIIAESAEELDRQIKANIAMESAIHRLTKENVQC